MCFKIGFFIRNSRALKHLSARKVKVGTIKTENEAPLSQRKKISTLGGVEISFVGLDV